MGQFYTTNQDYILQGMAILDNVKTIIEPFAGKGDLLKFIKEPHRLSKHHALDCGNPKCLICHSEKVFGEKTIQEQRFDQTSKWEDD